MEDFVTRNLSGGVWAHCHDVLHMTQLQLDIVQSSGLQSCGCCAWTPCLVVCASAVPH